MPLWGHCGWAHEVLSGGWAGGSGEERRIDGAHWLFTLLHAGRQRLCGRYLGGRRPPRSPTGGGVSAPCLLAPMPFALWCPCLARWLLCPLGICVLGMLVDRPGAALDLPQRLHRGRAPKRRLRSTPQVGRMEVRVSRAERAAGTKARGLREPSAPRVFGTGVPVPSRVFNE